MFVKLLYLVRHKHRHLYNKVSADLLAKAMSPDLTVWYLSGFDQTWKCNIVWLLISISYTNNQNRCCQHWWGSVIWGVEGRTRGGAPIGKTLKSQHLWEYMKLDHGQIGIVFLRLPAPIKCLYIHVFSTLFFLLF